MMNFLKLPFNKKNGHTEPSYYRFLEYIDTNNCVALIIDQLGAIKYASESIDQFLGHSSEEITGKNWRMLYSNESILKIESEIFPLLKSTGGWKGRIKGFEKNVGEKWQLLSLFLTDDNQIAWIIKNDTSNHPKDDKLISAKIGEFYLNTLLKMVKTSDEYSVSDLTDFTVRKAVEITESSFGYIVLLKSDETVSSVHSWRSWLHAFSNESSSHYFDVAQSGLWIEAIHRKKNIVSNNGQLNQNNAYSNQHTLLRQIHIPLVENNKVVAVIGVGNKKEEYIETEIIGLKLIIESLWQIIKRRKAEESLVEKENVFKSVIEQSVDGIVICDSDGIITEWNKGQEKITELPREEAIGKKIWDTVVRHTPKDRNNSISSEKMKKLISDLFKGNKESLLEKISEKWLLTENGHRKLIQSIIFPIVTLKGKMLCSITRDITEMKINEENIKKIETQLVQSQKMETVAHLTGGIAHDFNNLITVIIGNAEIALMNAENLDDTLVEEITEIKRNAERAANLTRQLLSFSRSHDVEPQTVNMNNIISNLERLLNLLVTQDIDIVFKPEGKIRPVSVDPGQMEQLITNLVINARDAIHEGGKIIIETKNIDIDDNYLSFNNDLTPGKFVLLTISDNGTGIDKEVLPRIFEPFFTTKELGKGTGLGLSTCQGIVKQNNGHINVFSEKGIGTTFKLYFPSAEDAALVREKSDLIKESLPSGNENIVLIESDSQVREMTSRILKDLGYKVSSVSSIEEAENIGIEQLNNTNLFICDIEFAKKECTELFTKMNKVNMGQKTIYVMGRVNDNCGESAPRDTEGDFLYKPYSASDLAKNVRDALDLKVTNK